MDARRDGVEILGDELEGSVECVGVVGHEGRCPLVWGLGSDQADVVGCGILWINLWITSRVCQRGVVVR